MTTNSNFVTIEGFLLENLYFWTFKQNQLWYIKQNK